MKKNWEIKKLGEVCEIEYGTRVVKKRDAGTIYPVYGGGGATFFMDSYNREDCLIIARFGMSKQCTRFVKGKFFLNDSGLTVKSKNLKKIYQKFLDWYFLSLNDYIYSLSRGAAQKNLNVPMFREILIPIPPLSEQKQIVNILDKAFLAIDEAKLNAKKNLENAKELFQSKLQEIFENGKLRIKNGEWEEKKLGEVCEFFNGKAHEKIIDKKGNYIVINSKFISSDGKVIKRANFQLSPLYKNDIVFVMSDVPNGKALAKCFIIDNDNTYTLNQRIGLIRNKKLNIKYLFYYLNRNKYFLSFDNGENQTNLRKNDILNCPLIFPPLSEQKQIVQQLDELQSKTKKLEEIYQKKIDDLEELKKSILQKAFNAELT